MLHFIMLLYQFQTTVSKTIQKKGQISSSSNLMKDLEDTPKINSTGGGWGKYVKPLLHNKIYGMKIQNHTSNSCSTNCI